MVARQAGLPPELTRAPMRTVRPRDVTVYAHARPQLARLAESGLLHRLAPGFYAIVPQDRVGDNWLPSLEGAAAGIAAAEFGVGRYALMGMTAARLHHAIPRAVAVANVAAPRRREPLRLTDRPATIRFYVRDVESMRVERLQTDMGACLVTTPEQTVLDLVHLAVGEGSGQEAEAAIRMLLPRCDRQMLGEIAAGQRLKRALDRVLALEVTWR
ncbi:putative transcriptional regulator of viral defense system [Hamadaea flava]|uniref:Type IV toxin-antitoxin system AbiEi family antitoxin domain-containing protein n=1 Tax=Hamadaea flava TaxID=1742688 RepID=A0ABV8LV45_9ACTN|nr:type IV toxin-antitoxin system AbiEi family antitoxin domain-containing protein [Hamadaea flava]MCP2327528.1 putative transcriptional regulator of viral defense system [Hamadaea flava]